MQSPKAAIMSQSIERVSSLWDELQSSNRLPKGTLTTACEVELQELMRQIDIMVNTRKLEWERELKSVSTQLEVKDREYVKQKKSLEQKHKEVGELREELEGMGVTQEQLVTQYEGQVALLRKEVQKIKRDYERLQKKQQKSSKEAEREKGKSSLDQEEMVQEVKKLRAKLEECQQESRDWDILKRSFQNQIDNLQAQKKALTEKCDFMQQQSKTYQSQLDRRRQILDSSEFNLRTQITQLEGQLQRANDTISIQEEKIDKLRESLDEMTLIQRESTNENEKLLEDLNSANAKIRVLEESKSKLEADLQSQDGFIRMLEEDLSQRSQDVVTLEQTLGQKDEVIRSLSEANQQEETEQILSLKDHLQQAKLEIRNVKRSEKAHVKEMESLKTENEELQKDYEDVCKQLSEKTQLGTLEQREMKSLRSEISKLKDKLSLVEGSHTSEFEGMHKELSTLMTELHERTATVTKLTEECSVMKRQLQDCTALADKKDAEIYVANSQMEMLRKENRDLRQERMREKQSKTEMSRLKLQVAEMTDTYDNNMRQMEAENRRLKDDISKLKTDFTEAIDIVQSQLRNTKQQTDTSLQQLQLREQRKIQEVERSAEERIELLQRELSHSLKQLETGTRATALSPGNTSPLSQSLRSSVNTSLSQPTSPLKHGAPASSKILNLPEDSSRHSPSLWDSKLSSNAAGTSVLDDLDLTPDATEQEDALDVQRPPSDASFSEQFLAEENVRAKQLEKLIDSHIENLKLDTNAVIQKWVS